MIVTSFSKSMITYGTHHADFFLLMEIMFAPGKVVSTQDTHDRLLATVKLIDALSCRFEHGHLCELIVLPRLLARILERARRAGFVCDTFAQAIIKWGTRLCTPIATKSNAFGTGAPEFVPLDRLAAKVCFLVAVCPAIFCRIVGAHKLRLCSSPRGVFHSPAQQRQPDVMPCGERDRHSFLRAAPSCTSSTEGW